MKDFELKNIDSEDIEDLLVKVETSFNIQFVGNELAYITTFGQLCNHITNKIQLDHSNDCTSQQAFYKLREAISSTLQINNKTISTDSTLVDLFPRKSRRSRIKKLEEHLGFKINILSPPSWLVAPLLIIFLVSIFGLFFSQQIGFLGIGFSIAGFWIAHKIGNELDLQTVGQVAEKMTREHYLKSRRNPQTFNKKEVERLLTEWFSDDLDLDKSQFTREAKLQ
ncbi:MAG: hypothetical protein MUF43_06265 [Flavobacterium sp.]|jgi:acyl carrier protein|nr:hypothetical protein [Flavobacterium sp.]